jgi:hypothetical protein
MALSYQIYPDIMTTKLHIKSTDDIGKPSITSYRTCLLTGCMWLGSNKKQ